MPSKSKSKSKTDPMPDTTPITIKVGEVSFSFHIDLPPRALEGLACNASGREALVRAIHRALQAGAEELADDIKRALVRCNGETLADTQHD